MFEKIKQGEVNFIQVAHNDNCPTISSWNMDDCTCHEVEMSVHQDQKWFERTFIKASQINRRARRAAERAMHKAAGKSSTKTKAARATGAASKVASNVDANCSTRQKKGGAA